jgi:DNA-binding MarR family transcriptional regulator
MLQDLALTLSRLGLKPSDTKVLIVLMQNRTGLNAQDLARQTKIQRSTIDVILARLLRQGYALKTKIGARNLYRAQSVDQILFARERVLDDFRSLMPFVQGLDAALPHTDMRFFEGTDELEQFYIDSMSYLRGIPAAKRDVLSLSSGTDVMRLIPDLERFWVRRRVDLKIPVRIIAPQTSDKVPAYVTAPEKFRKVKYFDAKKYPFHAVLEVFGPGLITLYAPTKPIQGIAIRHEKLAASLRSAFNLMWDLMP